ncbi:Segregation and condensation protein A [subsurface metagenome]
MNNVENDTYRIRLDKFEGPFDLLIYLVKNSKININDISISEITKQFLYYLKEASEVNKEKTSNFIFTTSILLYLKSKTLIPQEIFIEDEGMDERQEFVNNLIEYQKFKVAAGVMKKNIEEEKVLIRRDAQLTIDFKDNDNWEEVSIMDLIIAFSKVAKEVDESVLKTVEMEEISIDDKIDEILDYLIKNQTVTFHLLFPSNCSKYVLIITFLALLELVKMKKIYILQHKLFGSIKITRRE